MSGQRQAGRRYDARSRQLQAQQNRDRILAVAVGVTFYALLALFPAVAALISIYGLFADAGTIQDHLNALAGLLPGGRSR